MHENIDQLPFAPIYFSFHIDAFRVFSMNNPVRRVLFSLQGWVVVLLLWAF